MTALYLETLIHQGKAGSIKDATAQQAELDVAAGYTQKGLAATKPPCTSDADFNANKTKFYPNFYSAVGYAAFLKKDSATAIDAYKKELAFVPLDATKTPGPVLVDTFNLGQTYMQATPPDYLSCTFYASRALAYAAGQLQSAHFGDRQVLLPQVPRSERRRVRCCTGDRHGKPFPSRRFRGIGEAGTNPGGHREPGVCNNAGPEHAGDGDKEYVLQNGTPEQAGKVWDLLKGKSYQLPDVLVIASTPAQLQVAVTDDAKNSKTADFTVNLTPPDPLPEEPKAPAASATPAAKAAYKTKLAAYNKAKAQADALAAATAVGATTTVAGTYDSFTPNPIMITMKDGEVILPKAAAPKPAAHPAAHKPAAH